METLNTIITNATATAIQGFHKGDTDWLLMERTVMEAVTAQVTNANAAAAASIAKTTPQGQKAPPLGDRKIPMPKCLTFGQVAEILNAVMTIKVITDGDSEMEILGIYNGDIHDPNYGVYETNYGILYSAATQLNHTFGRRDLDEVINRLLMICEKVEVNRNRDLIAVNNGVFHYKKKVLMSFDESYVFLSKSAVEYNEHAQPKTFADGWNVEDWLKDIAVDEDVADLLWKTAGAALRPYVKWNKTVWLFSTSGNNGKGTYCQLLRNLLGPKACTSIPLSDFAKDFALGPLIGKQAIITDENDVGQYLDRLAIMKAVVTGDVFTITRKFERPITYRFRGMMVQCLNEYPRVRDKSDSFYRRQVFVPFEKTFTGRENKNIKDQYLQDPDVLEYVMLKLLQSDYYELPEPAACKIALSDYKENNDPVRQFWAEFEDEFVWDLLPYPFLFDLYKAWYEENFPRDKQMSRPSFINALKTIVQRESIVWTCDNDNKKKYRPGDRMSKTELLIDTYHLKNWESKSYQGRDPKKRCTLTTADLSASYAGLLRK